MAIPKWVHNNPITKSLVPMIEEAQRAGYAVEFGPTGKRHASGKIVAADVSHERKKIRIDPTQVAKDFESRAWTKPQVEGVRGIKHEFANAGELAKFYLAHELEHTTPGTRVGGKANNENATNERAMKRMLPKPKVISTPPAQPKMANSPAKQIPSDQVPKVQPTEAELSALWDQLIKIRSNRFSARNIKAAVAKLVKKGKIRPQAEFTARSYAVFAEDFLRQRDEAVDPRRLAGAIQERYFLGGQAEAETPEEREMLRTARTSAQAGNNLSPMDRPRRSLGIPESEEQLIRRSLQTPAGKALAESTIRSQRRLEGRRVPKNPLDRLRPRAPRPAEKPTEIKGSTLAEKMMRAKVVGKGIGTRATTKSGKPVFFRFKDSDRGRFYKPETLEKVLGPEGSDVLTGVAPIEKTAYAKFNRASEKKSVLAALLLAKQQQAGFKTGERVREATKTTRQGKVFFDKKTGTFKPVYRKTATGELMRGPGGEPIQETEILTPAMKARKRARSESRALGRAPSEEANRAARRDPGERTKVEQVKTVEGAIRQGVEERIRKGMAGPLTAKDAATLKKLQDQEVGKYDPEMLDELRMLSRIRDPRRQEAMRILEERMRSRGFPGVQHGLPIPPTKKSVVQPVKRLMLGKARRKMR